jgi:lambda family phage portal protein
MNFFDKALLFVSPRFAVNRLKARVAFNMINKRFFDGAGKSRRTEGWKTFGTSANAENSAAISTLRNRARDLVRNNAFASRGLQVIVSNVIGYGIKTQLKNDSGRGAKEIQKVWNQWSGSTDCDFDGRHDYYGLQALAFRTAVESGESLVIRRKMPSSAGAIPVKIQVIEGDYIDVSRQDDNTEQGIEFDSNGKRTAYWIFKSHPGDNTIRSFFRKKDLESERVPAEDVQHIFRQDRAGQIRGVSWFAPIIIPLRELDEYMDATIVKQKVSACFAGFIYDIDSTSNDATPKTPITERLEPGAMEELPPGKDIKFPNPPTVNEFDPFTRVILRQCASGLGITYEAFTSDYSQVNFSSGRMGWLEFHRNIESWRWNMMIPQFCDPAVKWFIEAAELRGIRANGVKAIHTPPSREMIDPNAESNALVTQIRAGLKTLPEALRELGYDPEERFQEMADTNKELDRLGLILDTDPRRVMKASGSLQPSETAPADNAAPQRSYFVDDKQKLWEKVGDEFRLVK